MAIQTLNAVGFCAHYSEQGDRAFKYALKLSQKFGIKLNVFHFLSDPYVENDNKLKGLPKDEIERIAIAKEKDLRLYYEEMAGEYLDVGFRVCYDNSWIELHRCLIVREFQILVLGHPGEGAMFNGRKIEDFAMRFTSPVILVGPHSDDELYFNQQAALMNEQIEFEKGNWVELKSEAVA